MSNTPPTQQELLERQKLLLDRMDLDSGVFNTFLRGSVSDTIDTDSGAIPSLAGLVEQVLQTSGARRYEIAYFVEDLTRYANGNEPLVRALPAVRLIVQPDLINSMFRLATPTSQLIQLTIEWAEENFVIEFPANSAVGNVVSSSLTSEKVFEPGDMFTLKLTSGSWTAKGLVLNIPLSVSTNAPA